MYIRKPLAGRVVQKKPNGDGVDKKTPFALNWRCGPPTAQRKAKGGHPVNDVNSLSHTTGIANIILYLHQSIAGRYFMEKSDGKSERFCERCATGRKSGS